MAVDGNIIIMEKIRDEVRNGISFSKAVSMGFDSALWTLLDANITSAAAGLCLLNFGTGPVRGFAVTLLIGLAVTLYTAYSVSKIFFEFYMLIELCKDLQFLLVLNFQSVNGLIDL